MLESIELFLINHTNLVDKVLNIFAVVIGGVLTYTVNIKMSNREYELKMIHKNREEVLIPLCSNLEELRKYLLDSTTLININREEEFIQYSSECTKFLKANKRLYLDKRSRKLLSNYKKYLKEINDELNSLVKEIYIAIEKNLKGIERRYILADEYIVGFKDSSVEKIENSIFKKEKINGANLISEIMFIINYEDNFDNQFISIELMDDYYPQDKESKRLKDYLLDNSKNINKGINERIERNKIGLIYGEMLEIIDQIIDHLIKEIDKISDN